MLELGLENQAEVLMMLHMTTLPNAHIQTRAVVSFPGLVHGGRPVNLQFMEIHLSLACHLFNF